MIFNFLQKNAAPVSRCCTSLISQKRFLILAEGIIEAQRDVGSKPVADNEVVFAGVVLAVLVKVLVEIGLLVEDVTNRELQFAETDVLRNLEVQDAARCFPNMRVLVGAHQPDAAANFVEQQRGR